MNDWMKTMLSFSPREKSRTWLHELRDFLVVCSVAFCVRTFIFGLYFVPSGSMETTLLVGDSLITDKLTPWFSPIQRQEVIAFNQPDYAYSSNPLMNVLQRYVLGIFWGPQNWTKRVIAIAGDRLEGKIEGGRTTLYLNGSRLEEPYVNQYPLIYIYKKQHHESQARALGLKNDHVDLISWDPEKTPNNQPFYPIEDWRLVRIDGYGRPDKSSPVRLIPAGMPQPGRSTIDIFDVTIPEGHVFVMGDNRNGSYDSRFSGVGMVPTALIHGRVKYIVYSFYDPDNWMIVSLLKAPFSFLSKFRFDRFFKKVV